MILKYCDLCSKRVEKDKTTSIDFDLGWRFGGGLFTTHFDCCSTCVEEAHKAVLGLIKNKMEIGDKEK
jgi:hypothetical protein